MHVAVSPGNGKGHRDPPLCLKRLLCFGEGTWRKLRGVVGKKGRGRAIVRPKAQPPDLQADEPFDPEDEHSLDLPVSDLNLRLAVLNWWEVARWHEVPDEGSLWGDPSPDAVRIARDLRRGKRMDT
jgi:hypothetical protein